MVIGVMILFSISPSEDPRSMFYVGQVVLCHVLSCQPTEGKLRLSFKVSLQARLTGAFATRGVGHSYI